MQAPAQTKCQSAGDQFTWQGWSAMETQWRVENLLSRYAACIDEDNLESWPDFFCQAACHYDVITRENIERGLTLALMSCSSHGMLVDRIVSLREANIYPQRWYRHIISSVLIVSAEADALEVQSHYLVLQTRRNGQTEIFSAGKYLDRIVLDEGILKFAQKRVIADTHRVDTLLVAPI
jgi:anthranilate 1,2-dioxygenase small subunit